MKTIDKLLNRAEQALTDKGDKSLVQNNCISQTKVGAIAGFGAMVINIGLLPTLAVYRSNNKEILIALEEVSGHNFDTLKSEDLSTMKKRLCTEKFINASIALKLMARTFNIQEKDGNL